MNILDLPIPHDLGLVDGIRLPAFLHDLMKFSKLPPKNAEDIRKGLRSSPEALWVLISQFSSLSGVHMDHKGMLTWACVTTGMKLWFLIEPSYENLKIRIKNGQFEGLKDYTKIICILMLPGDILIMKPGTLHAVYTPSDSKVVGGHFLHPRFLVESLKMADISQKYGHLNNDPVPRKVVREQFMNLIEVSPPLINSELIKNVFRVFSTKRLPLTTLNGGGGSLTRDLQWLEI